MTKKELEKYEEMQDAFQTRCEKICHILRPLKDSYNYVYEFEINGDLIECEGMEYWSYGGEEKYYAKFPKEYIYMDDKEIQKIVDAELKKKEDEESRKKANDEKLKAEKEKAEYERLKKIYG
jgi:hypothetical protein